MQKNQKLASIEPHDSNRPVSEVELHELKNDAGEYENLKGSLTKEKDSSDDQNGSGCSCQHKGRLGQHKNSPVSFYVIDPQALATGKFQIEIKDKTANPAAMGLLGFGLTTFLLNIHNAGVYPINSMILAMGFCYGGLAQIIAGIFDYQRGNMFGMIAFLSYGFFWWSFVFVNILPKMGLVAKTDPAGMACYMFIWGIFSLCMLIATFKKAPWALVFVFFTVVVLFELLAAHFWSENAQVLKAAGIEGIICGLSAIYVAFGEILNETYGRTIIPLGVRTPKK